MRRVFQARGCPASAQRPALRRPPGRPCSPRSVRPRAIRTLPAVTHCLAARRAAKGGWTWPRIYSRRAQPGIGVGKQEESQIEGRNQRLHSAKVSTMINGSAYSARGLEEMECNFIVHYDMGSNPIQQILGSTQSCRFQHRSRVVWTNIERPISYPENSKQNQESHPSEASSVETACGRTTRL